MKMSSMSKVLPVMFAMAFLSSCINDKADEIVPNPGQNCDTTYYKKTIKPIIIANCATPGCHVEGNSIPDFTRYENIFANKSDVKGRINLPPNDPNIMPQGGPMSATDILKVTDWIDSGAPGCE